MKVIGICGGIGSGKSYICDLFKIEKITVFNFDDEAKNIYHLETMILIGRSGSVLFIMK
jgi:dephospho-CoA kinase